MRSQEVGPFRWGITFVGGAVLALLLLAAILTGLRWSFKAFDRMVDSKSIIKVENIKPITD
jgi:autotransporter translocation and assembly factor TamB